MSLLVKPGRTPFEAYLVRDTLKSGQRNGSRIASRDFVHEDDRDVLARLPPSAVLLTTVVHICGEVTAVSSARADRADSPIRPPFLQMRHLFRVVGAARPPEWPQ